MGGVEVLPNTTRRKNISAREMLSLESVLQSVTDNLSSQQMGQGLLYKYTPHKKQESFHSSTAKIRQYIGGNRSGKTVGGIVEDLWWVLGKHPYRDTPKPPVFGRVITVDFVNGMEKIIRPILKTWCPPTELVGGSWETAYSKQERTLRFANGSFLELMSYDQQVDSFAGTSRHFIHFDEEPPKDIFTENKMRLIDVGGFAWLTMTPVEGMTWTYQDIYLPGIGEAVDREEGPKDKNIDIIEVDMEDNPYLDPEEIETFLAGMDKQEKEARKRGRYVRLGGLVYPVFDHNRHILPAKEVEIPKLWPVFGSIDHGLNNPTSVLWHAVTPEGRVITFAEYYVPGRTVRQNAEGIIEKCKELGRFPELFIIDPSTKNRSPIDAVSVIDEYRSFGLPVIVGNNDVAAGLARVSDYMTRVNTEGKPFWQVSSACKMLLWELGKYKWKTFTRKQVNEQYNKFEVPHKKDDHACDALRYFLMSRPDLRTVYHGGRSHTVLGGSDMLSASTVFADKPVTANTEGGWSYATAHTNWNTRREVYDDYMGSDW